ncbi:MAG: FAD/NAD(P)-binding protein [Deltaproteobacteria bacterium]|nr:FAD/NAD(P)-binding protein [Deltaproteobacteria bacterium]
MNRHPFLPQRMKIARIVDEVATHDILTFELVPLEGEIASYLPGQFAEISVFGVGEAPFGYASSPHEEGLVRFTVKRMGALTQELHRLGEGAVVGMRGPLGNSFELDRFRGKDLIVVGGGYAFTTLRSLIAYLLTPEHRGEAGRITLFYGVRNPGLFLYKPELEQWRDAEDFSLHLTVDAADEDWTGPVALVPDLVKEVAPETTNAVAVVCGPPPMIRFTLPVLEELGLREDDIFISMEMKMKCGVGMCGRCNLGPKFVCKDGPVFTLKELRELTDDF